MRRGMEIHHQGIVEMEVAAAASTTAAATAASMAIGATPPPSPAVLFSSTASGVYDCGTDDAGQWLEIRNDGLNAMRIETCGLDFNKEVCKGGAPTPDARYNVCGLEDTSHPTFVPPNSTLALRVSANVTYIVAIYCVNNPNAIHCMSNPTPVEFYGATPEVSLRW